MDVQIAAGQEEHVGDFRPNIIRLQTMQSVANSDITRTISTQGTVETAIDGPSTCIVVPSLRTLKQARKVNIPLLHTLTDGMPHCLSSSSRTIRWAADGPVRQSWARTSK